MSFDPRIAGSYKFFWKFWVILANMFYSKLEESTHNFVSRFGVLQGFGDSEDGNLNCGTYIPQKGNQARGYIRSRVESMFIWRIHGRVLEMNEMALSMSNISEFRHDLFSYKFNQEMEAFVECIEYYDNNASDLKISFLLMGYDYKLFRFDFMHPNSLYANEHKHESIFCMNARNNGRNNNNNNNNSGNESIQPYEASLVERKEGRAHDAQVRFQVLGEFKILVPIGNKICLYDIDIPSHGRAVLLYQLKFSQPTLSIPFSSFFSQLSCF